MEQNLQFIVRYQIFKFVGCDRKFYWGSIIQWPQKRANMTLHSHLSVCLQIYEDNKGDIISWHSLTFVPFDLSTTQVLASCQEPMNKLNEQENTKFSKKDQELKWWCVQWYKWCTRSEGNSTWWNPKQCWTRKLHQWLRHLYIVWTLPIYHLHALESRYNLQVLLSYPRGVILGCSRCKG